MHQIAFRWIQRLYDNSIPAFHVYLNREIGVGPEPKPPLKCLIICILVRGMGERELDNICTFHMYSFGSLKFLDKRSINISGNAVLCRGLALGPISRVRMGRRGRCTVTPAANGVIFLARDLWCNGQGSNLARSHFTAFFVFFVHCAGIAAQ